MKRIVITAGLACALAAPGIAAAQNAGSAATPRTGRAAHGQTTGAAKVAQADRDFAGKAAMGGMAEVDLGRLAVDKAGNADVKQFGQRMIDDHSQAGDELKSWARQKDVTLPTELDPSHKATHDRLAKLSGDAFDRAYMKDMVADHNQDVAEFQRESKTVQNPDLKAWVNKTLPVLKEHQKLAREVNEKVSTSTTAKKR